jgi:hypothetical protein
MADRFRSPREEETPMRTAVLAFLALLLWGSTLETARADPYHWCAMYGGGAGDDGGTNCYFVTLEQCRAAVSGVGGFCAPNWFYDGRPVTTPGEPVRHSRRRHR